MTETTENEPNGDDPVELRVSATIHLDCDPYTGQVVRIMIMTDPEPEHLMVSETNGHLEATVDRCLEWVNSNPWGPFQNLPEGVVWRDG